MARKKIQAYTEVFHCNVVKHEEKACKWDLMSEGASLFRPTPAFQFL